jgi:tetratricopeptide (TPR) repeat protein
VSFICKNPECSAPENKKGKSYPAAMECPFCDEPLAEIISLPESDLNLINNLPYVIAYPLKRALLEKHPLTRINLLKDTFLNYLKYIGLIAASEFFNSPIKDKKMIALFDRTLRETSFGLWNEFIREMLKFLNESNHRFFCPELNKYYITVQTGDKRKLYKGEVYVEDAYGDTQIIKQNLTGIDMLINFRNRYLGHQQTLDDNTYVKLWEQYYPIFKELLTQMHFVADYVMCKTEHGETYQLHSAEITMTESEAFKNSNVWIQYTSGSRMEILPFFVVPAELSIKKEDKEQIMVYESFAGKTIKFFSPEGTEKQTSGKILERLKLLLREKQLEQPYTPETFTKAVFNNRIADENKFILDTLLSEKKVLPGVYVNRREIEIKLREWTGSSAGVFFIAAEAGSGKTNLLVEMQRQYAEMGFNGLLIRAGRMEKESLKEQIAYLLNLDHTLGLGAYPTITGTQAAPTFFLIDGLNEAFHAENIWKEILEISRLSESGGVKFVVASRANSRADLERFTLSDEEQVLLYVENEDSENGLSARTFWLPALNMEEMKGAWDVYAAKDKGRFKPLFTFDQIATFDRAIYNQINNPLTLRIFLEVYNRKNLPTKGTRHLNVWQDWLNTFSDGEKNFLNLLATQIWEKGENELLLDDLLKAETIKDYLLSDNINAPYQRLKNMGWVSRYVKDLNVCVGFTVEGALLYIIGTQMQERNEKVDVGMVDQILNEGSELQKAGLEAFLCEEALQGELKLITALIDTGDDDKVDICIRPLLYYLKGFGVEVTLANLLENSTDNDWKALLQLNKKMNELQLQVLRKEFLQAIIKVVECNGYYDTLLALKAIALIDDEEAKLYFEKINIKSEFIQNDSDILTQIAKCEYRFARYDKALELYNTCLNLELKSLGEENKSVAETYNNIGITLANKGDYDKALEYYEKSLGIKLKILGAEHPSVARSYNNIGIVWKNKRDFDKALEYYHKSLEIKLKTQGSEHPSVAKSYNNMGVVWKDKNNNDKALEFYQKCLDIELKILGADHLSVSKCYNNMGICMRSKKDYDKALFYYQKSLDIKLRTLGPEHPEVANVLNNIGFIWKCKGDLDKAFFYVNGALDIRLKKLGIEHEKTRKSIDRVKSLYKKLGREKEMPDWMRNKE